MSVLSLQQKVARGGLAAGPLLALLLYFALPLDYLGASGETVPLTHQARATLAMMVCIPYGMGHYDMELPVGHELPPASPLWPDGRRASADAG